MRLEVLVTTLKKWLMKFPRYSNYILLTTQLIHIDASSDTYEIAVYIYLCSLTWPYFHTNILQPEGEYPV